MSIPGTCLSELDRHCSSARNLLEALAGSLRASITDGKVNLWAAAAHSCIDLLAQHKFRDPWLDWISENH